MIIIKIILWTIGILAMLFVIGWINSIRALFTRDRKLENEILPALQAIEANDLSATDIISKLAKNPSTRRYLYQKLKEMNKEEIFPSDFCAVEKIAESDLVSWLLHPNELNAAPSEIELVKAIPVKEENINGKMYLLNLESNLLTGQLVTVGCVERWEKVKAVQHMQDYIEQNQTKPITMHKIAQAAGYSSFHAARMFKSGCGYRIICVNRNIATVMHFLCTFTPA